MIKPNFSESQLQQLVNTEITMACYANFRPKRHWWFHPIIFNLIEEGDLGWDTAYYFPWLLNPPDSSGANFFIQYKLSKLIEGNRAKEWQYWGKEYLRFQIPYTTKDNSTRKYIDDFSQFNALKNLANRSYQVFYATNHIIEKRQLFQLASSQRLLSEIPALSVSSINKKHKKVTFTDTSRHFLLHSEVDEKEKLKIKEIISKLADIEKHRFSQDVTKLKDFLLEVEKELNQEYRGFQEEFAKVENYPQEIRVQRQALIIAKYLKSYLDIYWYRI
jgi:hypothetical protein